MVNGWRVEGGRHCAGVRQCPSFLREKNTCPENQVVFLPMPSMMIGDRWCLACLDSLRSPTINLKATEGIGEQSESMPH